MAGHRVRSTISSAPFSPHQIDCRDIPEQNASCSSPPKAGIGDAYRILQGTRSRICAAYRDDEEAGTEVVASSTGNHGAAGAYAAKLLNVPAKIFLPVKANLTKQSKIRACGAEII